MNPALLFLVRRSFANAIRAKLRRLKNPRYLVPTVVGLGYFVFLFGFRGSGRPGATPDSRYAGVGSTFVEWGATALFLLMAVSAWVFPARGSPFAFLESEVALLFPAPVARRELVRYKLLDMQKYLVIGPLFIALMNIGRLGAEGAIFVFLGGWLAFAVLTLHGIGAKLTRMSLSEHGGSGWRRQAVPLLVLVSLVAFVAAEAPPLPQPAGPGAAMDAAAGWLDRLGSSPAGYALLPFRLLTRTFLAPDLAGFLQGFAGAAGLGFLLYLWVVRNDVAFEEAAAAQAEGLARRIEAARKGRFTTGVPGKAPRKNPWRLGVEGSPEIAFVWKSVTEALRSYSPRLIIIGVIGLFVAVPIAIKAAGGSGDPAKVFLLVGAGGMAGIAALLVIAGPTVLGVNLRQDLERVEALKTLPLTGARLVRSSLVGTVLPVAAVQAIFVILAVILVPETAKGPAITPAWRVAAGMVGMTCLPCLTALSAAVDAAGALFFPAWVKPGQPPVQGGMEGMGYGIVTAIAKALVFGFGAAIPFGLGIGIGFLGVHFGGPLLGPAAAMVGALFAGSIVLVEAWVACRILGARFDRLDPAEEGMIS